MRLSLSTFLLALPALAPIASAQSDDLLLIVEGTITQTLAPVVGPLAGASVGDQFSGRFVVGRAGTQLAPGWRSYPYVFNRGSITIGGERAGFDPLSPLTSFWVSNDVAQIGDSFDAYVGLALSNYDVQFAIRDNSGQMIDTPFLGGLVGPIDVPAAGNFAQLLLRDAQMNATTVGQIFWAEVVDLSAQVGDGYCVASLNSSGDSARLEAFGSASVAANDLRLECRRASTFTFGLFIASRDPGFVPLAGGGQGNLCLGGTIGRFGPPIPSSGSTGVLTRDVDLTALPRPTGTVPAVPGATWYFQCWFRDSIGSTTTSNFSDSVRIRFQ